MQSQLRALALLHGDTVFGSRAKANVKSAVYGGYYIVHADVDRLQKAALAQERAHQRAAHTPLVVANVRVYDEHASAASKQRAVVSLSVEFVDFIFFRVRPDDVGGHANRALAHIVEQLTK